MTITFDGFGSGEVYGSGTLEDQGIKISVPGQDSMYVFSPHNIFDPNSNAHFLFNQWAMALVNNGAIEISAQDASQYVTVNSFAASVLPTIHPNNSVTSISFDVTSFDQLGHILQYGTLSSSTVFGAASNNHNLITEFGEAFVGQKIVISGPNGTPLQHGVNPIKGIIGQPNEYFLAFDDINAVPSMAQAPVPLPSSAVLLAAALTAAYIIAPRRKAAVAAKAEKRLTNG